MERLFHFNRKTESPVEKLVKQQKKETDRAIQKAKIGKRLNFSSQQMEIFNASFSYYVLAKWALEASFLSKLPDVEIETRIMSSFGKEAREIMVENELNNHAIQKLKEEMQGHIDSAPIDVKPSPRSIINAANYLSTLYIDCRLNPEKNFKKEFQKKAEFINTKIIRRP